MAPVVTDASFAILLSDAFSYPYVRNSFFPASNMAVTVPLYLSSMTITPTFSHIIITLLYNMVIMVQKKASVNTYNRYLFSLNHFICFLKKLLKTNECSVLSQPFIHHLSGTCHIVEGGL